MTPIQRQYLLPNCSLLLEGVSQNGSPPLAEGAALVDRPSLDLLTHMECQFAGKPVKLQGGMDLLSQLATAASAATQRWLSGVEPVASKVPPLIQIEALKTREFRLTVSPALLPQGNTGAPLVLTLSPLHLFDLVEAIDQMVADPTTLNQMQVPLTCLTRRDVHPDQPLTQRSAPLALGGVTLSLVAAVCFFLPIPEVREPKDPVPSQNPATETSAPPSPIAPLP